MELSSLTPEQLKQLVHGLVDDRLRELIGDPDLGLELARCCAQDSRPLSQIANGCPARSWLKNSGFAGKQRCPGID